MSAPMCALCALLAAGPIGQVDFQYQVVVLDAPSAGNTVPLLPDSITQATLDQLIYAEFWATDSGAVNTGIVSAYADLLFTDRCLMVQDITHSNVFTLFETGTVQTGLVDELGASQLSAGVGVEPMWVRVATVTLQAAAPCEPATIQLAPAASESSAFGRGLVEVESIDHGDPVNIVIPPSPPPCVSHADCADIDNNGIRDDGCLWWACEDATCAGTEIVFADMGGQFGDCSPDGATDGNDRFHALNCFSDQATNGDAGYPCEDSPPAAFNVDAGGQFGNCQPDGVCDGNDAFHALNAFAGSSLCGCPLGGPAPAGSEPHVVDVAEIVLRPSRDRVRPGDVITVDAFIRGSVSDLRGYQLHTTVVGGTAGTLDLMDISIADRKDHAFHGQGFWSAFNVDTAQMVAGLDGPGMATKPGGYLATFTYRVPPDARGRFTIGLEYDETDPTQRTFLFATPANGKIDVLEVKPAVVTVTFDGEATLRPRLRSKD